MKIIYTDENKKLKDFGYLIDSKEFKDFVNNNITRLTKYDYGTVRVQPHLCKTVFNEFFNKHNFQIGDKTEHAHGIGNNNMTYVQDIDSCEYIGAINLNSDMYGGVYCYATDINKNPVSNTYIMSKFGISLGTMKIIDWGKYSFEKEAEVLKLLDKAIQYGVLESGPDDGIIVIKEDGNREWRALITKEEAAKDLIDKNEVYLIEDAIKEMSKCEKGKLLEYKGIYFDEWTVDEETGNIFSEICEEHAREFSDVLTTELDDSGAIGCCSVYGCESIGNESDMNHYYVDFEPEHIHFITETQYRLNKQLNTLDDMITVLNRDEKSHNNNVTVPISKETVRD